MTERSTCPLCGGAGRSFVRTSRDRLLRCTACRLVFQHPQPDAAEMLRRHQEPQYSEMSYFQSTNGTARNDPAIDRLKRHLPAGARILDVGAGNGAFARAAADYFDVSALEPSAALAAGIRASDRPCVVLEMPFERLADEARYDAVVMNDVLEHTAYPPDVVAKAATVLRPGGLLWVHTVNTECLLYHLGPLASALARVTPFARYVVDRLFIAQHNWYFNPSVLARLLQQRGFAVVERGGLELPLQGLEERSVIIAGLRLVLATQRLLGVPTEQFVLARKAAA